MVLLLTDDQDEVLGGMVTLLLLPRPSTSLGGSLAPGVLFPRFPSPSFAPLAALTLGGFGLLAAPGPYARLMGPRTLFRFLG